MKCSTSGEFLKREIYAECEVFMLTRLLVSLRLARLGCNGTIGIGVEGELHLLARLLVTSGLARLDSNQTVLCNTYQTLHTQFLLLPSLQAASATAASYIMFQKQTSQP
jgi:hypothetical protein